MTATLVPLEFYHLIQEAKDNSTQAEQKIKTQLKSADKSGQKRPTNDRSGPSVKKLKTDGSGQKQDAAGPSLTAVQKFLLKKQMEEKQKLEAKQREEQRKKESLLKARVEASGGKITKKIAEQFQLDGVQMMKKAASIQQQIAEDKRKAQREKLGISTNKPQISTSSTSNSSNKMAVKQPVINSKSPVSSKQSNNNSEAKIVPKSASSDKKRSDPIKKKPSKPPPPAQLDFTQLLQIANKVKDKPVPIVPTTKQEVKNKLEMTKPLEPSTKNLYQISPKSRLSRDGLYCTSVGVPKNGVKSSIKIVPKKLDLQQKTAGFHNGSTKLNGKSSDRPSTSSNYDSSKKPSNLQQPSKGSKLSIGMANRNPPANGKIVSKAVRPQQQTNGSSKAPLKPPSIPAKYQKPAYNPFEKSNAKDARLTRLPSNIPAGLLSRGHIDSDEDVDDDEDEDDYDSEMDDFIDDTPIETDSKSPVSHHIREIFGYDRRKYANEKPTDDRSMEVRSWASIQREEAVSARAGLLEDLEEYKKEQAEEKRKMAKLKGKK